MFNIEAYYLETHAGKKVDNRKVLDYINSFEHVILWGASYLGNAIGKYLLASGVKIENYWDMRCDELRKTNGIEVVMPYSTEDKDNTLVIYCIGNNVIRGPLLRELRTKGYQNVLRGDYLYMGAICPFDDSTGVDGHECFSNGACRQVFCERLSNIVKATNKVENPLHSFSVTFVINQRCSLGCKFCTSYMNEYPIKERKDVPVERVLNDIDKFFDAMDSVGTITVMGGEPFMHPHIAEIINRILEKDNFGILSIATSGTYPIKEEQLRGFQDRRVNVSFSNYEQSINSRQKEVFAKNVELVKKLDISYTVGVVMPKWSVPSTLYNLDDTEEEMIKKKQNCPMPPRCMQVKNGKLHPCDFGTAIYSLGIADYKMDYVDLQNSIPAEVLKEEIRAYLEQDYYKTCGHCSGMKGLTAQAAEQGYMDFKKPIE